MFFKNQFYLISLLLLSFFISCKPSSSLPDPLTAGWKGKKVCELLEENKSQRILKCTFAPGIGHERHFHLPHFGYTLVGSTFKIKDTTGTREINVKTGSYFNSNGTEWHEVLNIGDRTAIFLIIEPK
ncbi:MAG: cupin domain-containing protein [Flavobacteriales bacterium]|jgi:quercetin dioxygenase-like cupin family protein|tara:strand:- start:50 stop:430 length:381 start_codon:yes stop_codon:yes gene_type:complete